MKKRFLFSSVFIAFLLLVIIPGCSGRGELPVDPEPEIINNPDAANQGSGRALWGVWRVSLKPAKMEICIQPSRDLLIHYNANHWILPPNCDDCLRIIVNSYDPEAKILDVSVTLSNPFEKAGFDVRGILMTGDAGYELLNPDGWTELFDIPGGEIINPFKAFAKNAVHRIFFPSTKHTQKYLIYAGTPPQWENAYFAVDASWPANCREPYAIEDFVQLGELYDITGSSVDVQVTVRDWQNDVNGVFMFAPELTGEVSTVLTEIDGTLWGCEINNVTGLGAGDYNYLMGATSATSGGLMLYAYVNISITEHHPLTIREIEPVWAYIWDTPKNLTIRGTYFNDPDTQIRLTKKGEPDISAYSVVINNPSEITCIIDIPPDADGGLYDVEIINSLGIKANGWKMFDIITGMPQTPQDITPPWLSLIPSEICVNGDYAYVAGSGSRGVHIFDVSDKSNPVWLNWVPVTSNVIRDIHHDGEHVYVLRWVSSLLVYGDDEVNPTLLKTVALNSWGFDVVVEDGYAYVASSDGLEIIDLFPLGEAEVVKVVEISTDGREVDVEGGYAYLVDNEGDLYIIDVNTPESASIINSIHLTDAGVVNSIKAENGFAYAGCYLDGMKIIDVSPPETAEIIKTVELPEVPLDIDIIGTYAYIAGVTEGLLIVDVTTPESAEFVNSVQLSEGNAVSLWLSGGTVFVCKGSMGIEIVDVTDPLNAFPVSAFSTTGTSFGCTKVGDYVYTANYEAGVGIIDVTDPYSANLVNRLPVTGKVMDIHYSDDGLLYLPTFTKGLKTISIDNPLYPVLEKSLSFYGFNNECVTRDSYAFVANQSFGLIIVDIEPLDEMHIVETVEMVDARAVSLSGDYAYVACVYEGLKIVDINPVPDSNIVHEVGIYPATDVCVYDDYAYITSGTQGLVIVDISTPESASVINTVDIYAKNEVEVRGEFAYVARNPHDIIIVDIEPPESAYIYSSIYTPSGMEGIFFDDNIIYTSQYPGFGIFELWDLQ